MLPQVPPEVAGYLSLRYGVCGAAPMPRELIADFQRETGVKIVDSQPTTPGGKIFQPALLVREMESVLWDEVEEYGLVVTSCRAVRDERKGVVFNWTVEGNSEELISRLDKYSFAHEMV